MGAQAETLMNCRLKSFFQSLVIYADCRLKWTYEIADNIFGCIV